MNPGTSHFQFGLTAIDYGSKEKCGIRQCTVRWPIGGLSHPSSVRFLSAAPWPQPHASMHSFCDILTAVGCQYESVRRKEEVDRRDLIAECALPRGITEIYIAEPWSLQGSDSIPSLGTCYISLCAVHVEHLLLFLPIVVH